MVYRRRHTFVGYFIEWIQSSYIYSQNLSIVVIEIAEIIAVLFAGLWLKSNVEIVEKPKEFIMKVESKYYPRNKNTFIGEADKLKMYKELLDSEVITEDEFEIKKKELFNLSR